MKIELESLINWLQDDYQTVEIPKTYYRLKGDYSDVLDKSICIVKRSVDNKDYHKRASVSIEQLCKAIEDKYKEDDAKLNDNIK